MSAVSFMPGGVRSNDTRLGQRGYDPGVVECFWFDLIVCVFSVIALVGSCVRVMKLSPIALLL